MNFESMYKQSVNTFNIPDGLKESVFIRKRRKSFINVKTIKIQTLLIAFLIMFLISGTTVFAYSTGIVSVLKQVVFGDSIARQVVFDDDFTAGTMGVINRTELSTAPDYTQGLYTTLEEARLIAPFSIREPSYLPDNVTGLQSVGVWRVETTETPWLHYVIIVYDITLKNGNSSVLQLWQTYAGDNAFLLIDNISPVEKVIIGDIEGVLISSTGYFYDIDGKQIFDDNITAYHLNWLKDGIAYNLHVEYHDGYTLETMIKIAESIS
ncbi:MAG: hypothetical protein FWD38_05525 [Oscillospiraceae bacterium]|nr:hypothetical protein [Oscillospiraceae bacterium]